MGPLIIALVLVQGAGISNRIKKWICNCHTSSLSALHVGDNTIHVGDIPTNCFIWRTICVNSTHTKISILLSKTGVGAIAEKYLSYQIVKICPSDDVFLLKPNKMALFLLNSKV